MRYILTSTHYDLLNDEVQSLSDIDLRVEQAEMILIERYRQNEAIEDPLVFDGPQGLVRIDGWKEDSNGNPDTNEMDQDLVRRLRIVTKNIVQWIYEQEKTEKIKSENVGQKSATYRDNIPSLPSRIFRPLDKYDNRKPFGGFW